MGKSYTHLSLEERCLLQAQLEMGLTVSREMARNGWRSEPAFRTCRPQDGLWRRCGGKLTRSA
jgi:hypothetical protein